MVYVDDLRTTQPTAVWPFTTACHLTADTHAELVAFARRLGLSHRWIQDEGKPTEHFDLTGSMRRLAVVNGAKEESNREAARRIFRHLSPDDEQ